MVMPTIGVAGPAASCSLPKMPGRFSSDAGQSGRDLIQDVAGHVVEADVDRHKRDRAAMAAQERHRFVQLAAVRVRGQPALEHRRGGLAGVSELDGLKARHSPPRDPAQLVGVSLIRAELQFRVPGRLYASGQRIAQREVVRGRRFDVDDGDSRHHSCLSIAASVPACAEAGCRLADILHTGDTGVDKRAIRPNGTPKWCE